MKRIMLLTGLLVAIAIPALLIGQQDEPNVIEEQISSPVEQRLLALEDRIDDLEQRITQLENPGFSPVESPADSNDSELDCVKASKQVQDAKDSIELVKAQINSLSKIETKTAENRHEVDVKRYKLLVSLERNYLKIIHLAEKCPALNIDTMELKKKLFDCRAEKREAEMKRKALQDSMQTPKPSSGRLPGVSPGGSGPYRQKDPPHPPIRGSSQKIVPQNK